MEESIRFVGQERIMNELNYAIPDLRKGRNRNFLLKAQSGYGKTTLARVLVYEILRGVHSSMTEGFDYNLPDREGNIEIDFKKRVIVIDEVHTLKNPETIYPYMDSNKHIFILCTNEGGVLKEPLINRCIQFIFREYTLQEIELIVDLSFKDQGYTVPSFVVEKVARNVTMNPRVANKTVERLTYVFSTTGIPKVEEQLTRVLENILDIREGGLTAEHLKYLDFMRANEIASLNTLIAVLNLDRGTIEKIIEPTLIRTGNIRITSRGRKYIYG